MANPTLSTAEIEQSICNCVVYDVTLLQQGMPHVRKIYEVAPEMTMELAKVHFTKYLRHAQKVFNIDLQVGFDIIHNKHGVKFLDYKAKLDTKSKKNQPQEKEKTKKQKKTTSKNFSFGSGDINESAKPPQNSYPLKHWTTFPDSPIRLASPKEIAEKIKKLSPKLSTIKDDVVMTDA